VKLYLTGVSNPYRPLPRFRSANEQESDKHTPPLAYFYSKWQ